MPAPLEAAVVTMRGVGLLAVTSIEVMGKGQSGHHGW